MENIHIKKNYEIWVHNSDGYRIGTIDNYLSFSYSKALGSIGKFTLTLAADTPEANLIQPDCIIQFWRGKTTGFMRLDYGGLADRFRTKDVNGKDVLTVGGSDGLRILRDRIHAYRSSDARSSRADDADIFYGQLFVNNYEAPDDVNRDTTGYPIAVAAQVGVGSTITLKFPWKRILQIYNEVLNASIQKDDSPVYFDVEPYITNNQAGWFINFNAGWLKANRGLASNNPITFSKELGNLEEPELDEDYSDEVNVIYAGGEGEANYREIVTVEDTTRSKRAIWARKEAFLNFSTQQSADSLTDIAQQACASGRPKKRFTGSLKDTPDSRYGIDWMYGDLVVISYRQIFNALVSAISVSVDNKGNEIIKARVEAQLL